MAETKTIPTVEEIEEQRELVAELQNEFWEEVTVLEKLIAAHLGVDEVSIDSSRDFGLDAATLIAEIRDGEGEEQENAGEGYCALPGCCQKPQPDSDYCGAHVHHEREEDLRK